MALFLCRHSTSEEFTFRQTWQVGDVLMCHKRATVHITLADYRDDTAQAMMRTTMVGTPLGSLLDTAAPEPNVGVPLLTKGDAAAGRLRGFHPHRADVGYLGA